MAGLTLAAEDTGSLAKLQLIHKHHLWSHAYWLRGIKDWVQGFWGYIVAKFGSTLWKVKKLDIIVC